MIGDKVDIGKVKLQHNGTFDINKVHTAIADWINSHNYDYTENENTEKGARRGLESVIKFAGDRKVSDYVEFAVEGEIRTFEMKRKGKLQEGELIVYMKAEIKLGHNEKFDETQGLSFLKHVFNNFIHKRKLRQYIDKSDGEFNELQNVAKDAMDLYTWFYLRNKEN